MRFGLNEKILNKTKGLFVGQYVIVSVNKICQRLRNKLAKQ